MGQPTRWPIDVAFSFYRNEIQYGAQLTVRDGQIAVFVNEGQVADVFGAGLYKLETRTVTNLRACSRSRCRFEGLRCSQSK